MIQIENLECQANYLNVDGLFCNYGWYNSSVIFMSTYSFGQVMIIHIKITRINVMPLGKVSNWA
jgi:hypothetical protein